MIIHPWKTNTFVFKNSEIRTSSLFLGKNYTPNSETRLKHAKQQLHEYPGAYVSQGISLNVFEY